jgi:plasmid stabilization system protein ParE
VARVVVTPTADEDLAQLVETRSLPPDTRERVRSVLERLGRFPELGRALVGPWSGFRLVVGPWSWMLLVYLHDPDDDMVAIVTIRDARSATGATTREREREERAP